jgi:hypothetical protein
VRRGDVDHDDDDGNVTFYGEKDGKKGGSGFYHRRLFPLE